MDKKIVRRRGDGIQQALASSDPSTRDLGRFAAEVRRKRDKIASQKEFAHELGISNKQLSNIESAKNWPAMPLGIRLCRLLHIKLPKAVNEKSK